MDVFDLLTKGAFILFILLCIGMALGALAEAYKKLPDALEKTARVAGKKTADASNLAKKLRKAFDEERSKEP
mgnify:CR=1 FL=1